MMLFIYNVIIYLETLDNIDVFTNIYFLYYMCFNIKVNSLKYNY